MATHGGPGRGGGRKPISPSGETMQPKSVRMSERQKIKVETLGGDSWIRHQIDAAWVFVGLNATGRASLKQMMDKHLKATPGSISAWAEDVRYTPAVNPSPYIEFTAHMTKSGKPVVIEFDSDECDWTR